jgi:hypothetical protein
MAIGYLGLHVWQRRHGLRQLQCDAGLLQLVIAMFTAWFFARRYGGDWAALFAASLL